MWRHKTNSEYPSPAKVKREILQCVKGSIVVGLSPALAIWLSSSSIGTAYCGIGQYGWKYDVFQFIFIWVVSDLVEWAYHLGGHKIDWIWSIHRYHHTFFNPSPFAVVADELMDNFFRGWPLFLFPILSGIPINMDILFAVFTIFFYGYGVYLHCGHELDYFGLNAHNKWINTSFQHYAHHAIGTRVKSVHTGFFIKLWDQLVGNVLEDSECFCVLCRKNEKTLEKFKSIEKPDYSVLLSPTFWLN